MKLLATLFMTVLMSVTAFAADVDGTWTGTAAAPTGDVPVTFTFKADGAKLTGSTVSPDGTSIPIKDGKIDGSTITFTVTFDFGGTPFVLPYMGVVSSDQIKLSANAGGVPIEMLLKKSKAAAALDGTWDGVVHVQGRWRKADDGTTVPIKDGKVDGSDISYMVRIDSGGMPFDFVLKKTK